MAKQQYLLSSKSAIWGPPSTGGPLQFVDQYIQPFFYEATYQLYIPFFSIIRLPLNVSMLYYLYFDTEPASFEPYLRSMLVIIECASLISQLLLSYFIILSTGAFLVEYNSVLWKYTLASLLYSMLLFLTNDGSGILMIIYMEQTLPPASTNYFQIMQNIQSMSLLIEFNQLYNLFIYNGK